MIESKCDIILPVCDQFEFTKNCIDSMIRNTEIPYRIIVVNNGKNPDTRAYLKDVKADIGERLVVIENPTNVGWVDALNQGLDISYAPYLCFQNDDTIVTRGWLTKMIGIMERDTRVGVVNPYWEGKPSSVSIDDYGRSLEEKNRGKYIETDWARGFCVVFKRAVYEKIGHVDIAFRPAYFDDVDYSVQAIEAGFLCVLAMDTYVWHHRNVTFFQVLKGKKWNEVHERNKIIYYKKWGRPLKIAAVLSQEICCNPENLNKFIDSVYYLARKQHHIEIFSPCNLDGKIQHTNVKIKVFPAVMLNIAAFFILFFNSRKKGNKRYSAIFKGDGDFSGYMKARVDELKAKTKEGL